MKLKIVELVMSQKDLSGEFDPGFDFLPVYVVARDGCRVIGLVNTKVDSTTRTEYEWVRYGEPHGYKFRKIGTVLEGVPGEPELVSLYWRTSTPGGSEDLMTGAPALRAKDLLLDIVGTLTDIMDKPWVPKYQKRLLEDYVWRSNPIINELEK